VLTLPQRDTERILRERLAELGGEVERGVSLADLDTSGHLPRATLRHPDGTAEAVVARYVVGTDGPASAVRTLLGIAFDGDPIDVTYAIGDAPVTGAVPANAQYYYGRTGVVALVPLHNGHYRIAANIPHRSDSDPNPPRELLEQIVRERTGIDASVGEPDWSRSFRPRIGLAESYQQGRCFLAGDSAHVISPAGGQGMNVGFQDAVNLGWKLGGVLTGRLNESILDSYHPERASAAERMSRTSAAQARFALQRDTAGIVRRDAIFLAARFLGVLQRVLVPLLSQTDIDYGDLDTTPIMLRNRNRGPARPGQRVPLFAPPALADGTPALDPYRMNVVCWPGRRTPTGWASTVDALRPRFAGQAGVLDLASVSGRAAATLRRAFGSRPVLAVVRPDGHLAHLAGVDSPDEVATFLADFLADRMATTEPAALATEELPV
jgi:2-polyprenyl-6-methoxyphenol hydroxylase-like FAD-dependent oxidoreductase